MKDERLQLRASAAEKRAFKRAAKSAGLTLSDWLRTICRKQAAKELGEASKGLFRPTKRLG